MQTKIKIFKNDASATFEKCGPWYVAQWRKPDGSVGDKIRCDTYSVGIEYYNAFKAAAKNHNR